MGTIRQFQFIVALNWILQLLSYILPIPLWYSDLNISNLLRCDGYGAIMVFSISALYMLPLWGFLFASLGMLFFQNWGRYLYLTIWVYGWLSTLFFGLRIALPAQGFINMAIGTLDGAIIALAFLSPVRNAFSRVPP
jgi:hypothetical protein